MLTTFPTKPNLNPSHYLVIKSLLLIINRRSLQSFSEKMGENVFTEIYIYIFFIPEKNVLRLLDQYGIVEYPYLVNFGQVFANISKKIQGVRSYNHLINYVNKHEKYS